MWHLIYAISLEVNIHPLSQNYTGLRSFSTLSPFTHGLLHLVKTFRLNHHIKHAQPVGWVALAERVITVLEMGGQRAADGGRVHGHLLYVLTVGHPRPLSLVQVHGILDQLCLVGGREWVTSDMNTRELKLNSLCCGNIDRNLCSFKSLQWFNFTLGLLYVSTFYSLFFTLYISYVFIKKIQKAKMERISGFQSHTNQMR